MRLKRGITVPALITILLALGACSSQAWYEGVRQSGEQECRKQPPGAVDDCLSRINRQGYDDYNKARSAQ